MGHTGRKLENNSVETLHQLAITLRDQIERPTLGQWKNLLQVTADRAPEALPELARLMAAGQLTVRVWRQGGLLMRQGTWIPAILWSASTARPGKWTTRSLTMSQSRLATPTWR